MPIANFHEGYTKISIELQVFNKKLNNVKLKNLHRLKIINTCITYLKIRSSRLETIRLSSFSNSFIRKNDLKLPLRCTFCT